MTSAPANDAWSAAETQPADAREQALLAQLPGFIAHAQKNCRAYADKLAGVDAAAIITRDALAAVPITRKSALIGEQEMLPPFGGYDCFGAEESAAPQRVYLSPGPIAECDFAVHDHWRTSAALYATGFRAGMLLHNSFSYHFTPAGFMCDEGARTLGGRVFPAGAGNTEQQARAMAQLRPHCYTGTPDFLLTILQRAEESGLDVTSLRMGSVSGGYLSPQLRQSYNDRNIKVLQWYGTADVGCIAYETIMNEPLVLSEGLLLEIADPLTHQPCAPGEKGEILLTNFNPHYPLIRFSLGDLSAQTAGASPCGRTNMRIAGWLGRCDEAVKVRGMFIHPVQVERLQKKFPALAQVQLAVQKEGGRDTLILRCLLQEGAGGAESREAVIAELADNLVAETKLRGEVVLIGNAEEIQGGLIADERP